MFDILLHIKMSGNLFKHLRDLDDEEEEPGFAFGPSILESAAASFSFADGAAFGGAGAGGSSTSARADSGKLDLSAIADELLAAGASAAMMSGASAWDFSAFQEASKDAEAAIAEAAVKRREELIAQLEKMHAADKDEFKEKLNKFQLSRSQRRRRIDQKSKAEDLAGKLTVRLQKKSMSRKRFNQVKHL